MKSSWPFSQSFLVPFLPSLLPLTLSGSWFSWLYGQKLPSLQIIYCHSGTSSVLTNNNQKPASLKSDHLQVLTSQEIREQQLWNKTESMHIQLVTIICTAKKGLSFTYNRTSYKQKLSRNFTISPLLNKHTWIPAGTVLQAIPHQCSS